MHIFFLYILFVNAGLIDEEDVTNKYLNINDVLKITDEFLF